MAAEILSSPFKDCWDYDVFLSFRGEDTRKNFTDHLYKAFIQVGIHIFRDNEELPRGKTISTELFRAIHGSRICIVIFSKGYASSTWCLDELAEIMKCCQENKCQTFLPIFYHVDPSDVRKQSGTFAEAFVRHEERYQADMAKVGRWREALTEAGSFSGWDLSSVADGYEGKFIDKILDHGLGELNFVDFQATEYPVGMNSKVKEVKALLNLGTSNLCIVGIYGIGGIEVPASLSYVEMHGTPMLYRLPNAMDMKHSPIFSECESHDQANLWNLVSLPLIWTNGFYEAIQEFTSEDIQFPIIFSQNKEVPDWFSHQATGSSISFHVPSLSKCLVEEIHVCACYGQMPYARNCSSSDGLIVAISIYNRTKDSNLTLQTKVPLHFAAALCHIYRIPVMLFLSDNPTYAMLQCYYFFLDSQRIYFHRKSQEFFGRGDEMEVSIQFRGGFEVRKCGIYLKPSPPDPFVTVSEDDVVTWILSGIQ